MRFFSFFVMFIILCMPAAYSLQVSDVEFNARETGADIKWITDELSDSKVWYGTDENNLKLSYDGSLTKEHMTVLKGLSKDTSYLFKVGSNDVNDSKTYKFVTGSEKPKINMNVSEFCNSKRIDLIGTTDKDTDVSLYVNGKISRAYYSDDGSFEFNGVSLNDGENTIKVIADRYGLKNEADYKIIVDVDAPRLTILTPPPELIGAKSFTIKGNVSEEAFINVTHNENTITAKKASSFSSTISFEEGKNIIRITAVDDAGGMDMRTYDVIVDSVAPTLNEVEPFKTSPFMYEGKAIADLSGKTEPHAKIYAFISGMFITGAKPREPSIQHIIETAQYTAGADSEGNFKIKNIDFEHPKVSGIPVSLNSTAAGNLNLVGNQGAEQSERSVYVWVVAVDRAGLTEKNMYTMGIGSCFSGTFDFDIKPLPAQQYPVLLSPLRLEEGNEHITYVLDVKYIGKASVNKNDPKVDSEDKKDNWYRIDQLNIERACRINTYIERSRAYTYGCQLLTESSPLPIDVTGTKWFSKHRLQRTDTFTNPSEDFWRDLVDAEIRFPLKLTILYTEKISGKEVKKSQTICTDLSYAVDVPLDPRDVIPDAMLDGSIEVINESIKVLDEILPVLDEIVEYTGIACLGSIGLRFISGVYRQFIEKLDIAACNVFIKANPVPGKKCPTQKELEKCYYIPVGGKDPLNGNKRDTDCTLILESPVDMIKDEFAAKHFIRTTNAWKMESVVYTFMRFTCDRIFCKASPSPWTADRGFPEIKQKEYQQRGCGAEDMLTGRRLIEVKDCHKTVAEKLVEKAVKDKVSTCYFLNFDDTQAYYRAEGESLIRIDKAVEELGAGEIKLNAVKIDDNTWVAPRGENCKQICSGLGSFEGWCVDNKFDDIESEVEKMYPAGYTFDCWDAALTTSGKSKATDVRATDKKVGLDITDTLSVPSAKRADVACYCKPTKEQPESKKGVINAGTEKDGWEWSYRQWVLHTTDKGGVYYPDYRYYSGRDKPSSFGMNHILDQFRSEGNEVITKIDPFTDHLAAVQTVCLSGVKARLELLRNLLLQVNGCLEEIKLTGKANAGICREVFTQFICNLMSQVFTWVQNGCYPIPLYGAVRLHDPIGAQKAGTDFGFGSYVKAGSEAVTGSLKETATLVKSDYGNSNIASFLEGGTESYSKKICLAAFGIDTGFDLNALLDSAYTVPFKTSVIVTSSNIGNGGRRQFLTFNPSTGTPTYEYRAGWVIMPGCDFSSYRLELAAVSEKEIAAYPGVSCSTVGDIENKNGCDNLHGSAEKTRPFFAGGEVKQGQVINKDGALVIDSDRYRYDHIKVILTPAKDFDIKKCVNEKYVIGGNAVFYFPISDTTDRDIAECQFDVIRGEFGCSIFGDGIANAWINSVECVDPESREAKPCSEVFYLIGEGSVVGDPISVKTTIYSPGDKLCLKTWLESPSGIKFPDDEDNNLWVVPPLQFAGQIPISASLGGLSSQFVQKSESAGSIVISKCKYEKMPNEDDQKSYEQGSVLFKYEKAGKAADKKTDMWKLTVGDGVQLLGTNYKIQNFILKEDLDAKFTTAELKEIVFVINGFHVKGIFPKTDKTTTCKAVSSIQQTSFKSQNWDVHSELYYTVDGKCSGNVQKVVLPPQIANRPEMMSRVKVGTQRPSTEEQAYLKRCISMFGDEEYKDAQKLCDQAIVSAAQDSRIQILGTYYKIVSLIKEKENAETKETGLAAAGVGTAEIKQALAALLVRKDGLHDYEEVFGSKADLKDRFFHSMIIGYLNEFANDKTVRGTEEKDWFKTKYRVVQKISSSLVGCSDCVSVDTAWEKTWKYFANKNKYYAPESAVTGFWDARSYKVRVGGKVKSENICEKQYGFCTSGPKCPKEFDGKKVPSYVSITTFDAYCPSSQICCRVHLSEAGIEQGVDSLPVNIPITIPKVTKSYDWSKLNYRMMIHIINAKGANDIGKKGVHINFVIDSDVGNNLGKYAQNSVFMVSGNVGDNLGNNLGNTYTIVGNAGKDIGKQAGFNEIFVLGKCESISGGEGEGNLIYCLKPLDKKSIPKDLNSVVVSSGDVVHEPDSFSLNNFNDKTMRKIYCYGELDEMYSNCKIDPARLPKKQKDIFNRLEKMYGKPIISNHDILWTAKNEGFFLKLELDQSPVTTLKQPAVGAGLKEGYVLYIQGDVQSDNFARDMKGGAIIIRQEEKGKALKGDNIADGMTSGLIAVHGTCDGTIGNMQGGIIYCAQATTLFQNSVKNTLKEAPGLFVYVGEERIK